MFAVIILPVLGVLALGFTVFFVWANAATKDAHANFQKADVIKALEEMVAADSTTHDPWDLFLAWPISDPRLESIRTQCLRIIAEFPREHSHEDISQKGVTQVRSLLDELNRTPDDAKRAAG